MRTDKDVAVPATDRINRTLKILTFMDYYLPGFKAGGPVRTVAGMVALLSDRFDFLVVTRDREPGDQKPYPNVRLSEWVQVGAGKVFYIPKDDLRISTLVRVVRSTRPDVLYANSFFSRITIRLLVARRLGLLGATPMVLAPRGEFSPGSLRIRQGRKRTFIALGRRLGLFDNLLWQASAELEQKETLNALGLHETNKARRKIIIARDLFEPRKCEYDRPGPAKTRGRVRFVFVSRISPKKNLHTAIQLLNHLTGDVSLDIYGSGNDQEYWQNCQAAIDKARPGVEISWRGFVEPDKVIELFSSYDFFLFPTFGENFGHVIIESLSAGCPVVLSDTTPWDRIEAEGAGWIIPLARRDRWIQVLQTCVDMDHETHLAMRQAARSVAHQWNDQDAAVQQNRALFETAFHMRTT